MTTTIHESNGKESTATNARALTLDVRPDGVAVITYDVPGEAVNTLKASFAEEFEQIFSRVANDPKIKAAILVSGKKDAFIAGADVAMLERVKTAAEAEQLCRTGHKAILKVVDCPKPVVAAVHGAALGGGFEVALACHARVLSDDKKTALGLPEVQLGLVPGMNGLERLAAIVGLQIALEHGLAGKNIRAPKAKKLGLADDVVPVAILREVAAELALKLAAKGAPFGQRPPTKHTLQERLTTAALEKNPVGRKVLFKKARAEVRKKTGGHYPAPEKIIDVLETWADKGFDAAREVEAKAFGELVISSVARRLIEIFFAQTALKKDSGVDDHTVKAQKVDKIAMLGAGLMGAGIAYVSIEGGIPVRLKDKDDPSLARGLKYVGDIFDERVKRKQLSRIERDQKLAKLTATTDYSGMHSVDLVIEAVFEDLAVKHAVVREVEKETGERTIFASNTSSIPITKIAEASKRPENVVGMHYFSPVHKMPLLEVIQTKKTSPSVVATAVAVGKKQGKTVIVVNDGVGFYTSRILGPMMNEASYLLVEGASIEQIDKAMTGWGWPVGPITLLDEVGIDVAAHVGPIMVAAFGERMAPPPTVQKLAKDDRKGRKNEKGFYLYGAKAKELGKGKHVDPTVYAAIGLPEPDPKATPAVIAEEIQMRCSLQLVNEALHCFGEGILRSARDGDVGAVFGLGFPPFRGGPFRYVDAVGPGEVLRRIEVYHQRFGARWTPAPALVEKAKSNGRFYP
jgi:3-hydroxyacyl-CoA dehydrogenase / enoyl-CoA hydratase / 3-hydroxybutyryl-CoA epimerase